MPLNTWIAAQSEQNDDVSRLAEAPVAGAINDYWEHHYSERESPHDPSPFALEVAGLLRRDSLVIEFGCGNGRDSLHFASLVNHVIAIDASHAALEIARTLGKQQGLALEPLQLDLAIDESYERLHQRVETLRRSTTRVRSVTVYARFLLHAVTPSTQDVLVSQIAQLLNPGEQAFFEYRTGDINLPNYKYGKHYRRSVSPNSLESRARELGFASGQSDVSYKFAQFGDEKPFCGRTVLTR